MIGVEVVAILAAISGAFNHGLDYLERRKVRKLLKKEREKQLESTEVALRTSGPAIQAQFEQHFSRLGDRFAVGDAIAQVEIQQHFILLQQTIMTLQQAVITELQAARRGQIVDVDFSSILATSHAVRSGCIDSLKSQYRRMSQAAAPMNTAFGIYAAGVRPPPFIDLPSWPLQVDHHVLPAGNPSCNPRRFSSEKTLVAVDDPSICSSKYCLLRYLHDVEECLPSRADPLAATLSRSLSSWSLAAHEASAKKKIKVPHLERRNLTHGSKHHQLSTLQAFLLC